MYLVLLIFVEFILLVIVFFFAGQFFNIIFRGYAPFISTNTKVTGVILGELKALNLKKDSKVYELGCGRAGFLSAAARKYPQLKLIGIEYSFLPFLLAKIQAAMLGGITIYKQDMFKVNLRDADLIYCYLNQEMMKKLQEKFKHELRRGMRVISYQFKLPEFVPDKVIEVPAGNGNKILPMKEKIYFYSIK